MFDSVSAACTGNRSPQFARQKIRYLFLGWIWVLLGDKIGQLGFGFSPASSNDLRQFVQLDFQKASCPRTSDANRCRSRMNEVDQEEGQTENLEPTCLRG